MNRFSTIFRRSLPLQRPIAVMASLFCVFIMLGVAPSSAAAATTPPTKTGQPLSAAAMIIDDAHIIDTNKLVGALNKLDRTEKHQTARVAVFTTDQIDPNDYDQSISNVLIKKSPPGVIEKNRLAPNVVLITISPKARKIGVYIGEKLPREHVRSTHLGNGVYMKTETSFKNAAIDNMKPYARSGDWDNAAFVGAETYLSDVGIVTNTKTAGNHQESRMSAIIDIALLSIAGSAVLAFVIGLIVTKARRRRKDAETIDAFTAAHDSATAKLALKDWWDLDLAWHKNPALFRRFGTVSQGQIQRSITALRRVIYPDNKSIMPEIWFITSTDIEEIFTPQKHLQQDLALTAVVIDPIHAAEKYATLRHEQQKKLNASIYNIASNTKHMHMPKESTETIQELAKTAKQDIDNVLKQAASTQSGYDTALFDTDEIYRKFKSDAADVVRGLSSDERQKIVKPDRPTTVPTVYTDSNYLWWIFAAEFMSDDSSSSSHPNPSVLPFIDTSSSNTSSFSGGGFTGGSASF